MIHDELTQQQVIDLFEYKDGHLFWKHERSNIPLDKMAGYIGPDQRVRIRCKSKNYLSYRLIFLMHKGYLPQYIDHIDGDRLNNKIENLREATISQNNQNIKKRITNTSSEKNVYWCKRRKKWTVKFTLNEKQVYVGHYVDLELAGFVAQMAREKYHGEFANHG